MTPASCHLTEELALLVTWALRVCLGELEAGGCGFAKQMLRPGDEYDALRPEARALPLPQRDGAGLRVGLIVQPYFWALALAMLDISRRRRQSLR